MNKKEKQCASCQVSPQKKKTITRDDFLKEEEITDEEIDFIVKAASYDK